MTTYKIFLAASSELESERKEFERFVYQKTKDWQKQGVFLELVIWEDFLDVMSQTRLQDEYNKAIKDCSLFVMLFCTKVGKYTEEEFNTAFGHFQASNQPFILTYFKDDPTARGKAGRADLQSLWAFQDKLTALGHYQTEYTTTESLLLHFTGQLDKLAADGFIQLGTQASINPGGEHPAEARSVIAHYLDAMARDLAGLRLGEIDPSVNQAEKAPLNLADIYVPLRTTLFISKRSTLSGWLNRKEKRSGQIQKEPEKIRPVSALEALAQHRQLVLLGKPGGGKSTFGARVLLALAQVYQGHESEREVLGAFAPFAGLLPIRVILRRFAETLASGEDAARAGDLWQFIGEDLKKAGFGLSDKTLDFIQRVARSEGVFILFDGLDECGDEQRRRRVRAAIDELISHASEKCRFLLTARPYACPSGPHPKQGIYMLDDFDGHEIEAFITGWYAALAKHGWRSPGEADSLRNDLLAVRHRPDLLALAQNPLLLTLMTTLHSNKTRLPDDRVDLYNESVELLLTRWNEHIKADRALLAQLDLPGLKLADLRESLEGLAFLIHELNVGQEGAADIPAHRLEAAFLPLFNKDKNKADIVLHYIEERAGLLLAQGEKDGQAQYCFPHRTFQEFLAACYLAKSNDFPGQCRTLADTAPGHWQEVLSLAARVAGTERGASAADELVGGQDVSACKARPEPADWQRALLAGRQLVEIGPRGLMARPRTANIARRVVDWLRAGLARIPKAGGLPAALRLQSGDVLAALGDPRFDAERFFLPADGNLGLVRIDADPNYRIGIRHKDKKKVGADDDELNDELTPTPEFFISRYPVTVAQYRAYLQASGQQAQHAAALAAPDNRPVCFVNWQEARDYCCWLQTQLETAAALADYDVAQRVRSQGWQVMLPSELEWEKAARGGLADALYPWGAKFDSALANTAEAQLGGTSPVGMYPANGYGLHDMSGNVSQWTRGHGQAYPYNGLKQQETLDKGNKEHRTVCGGAYALSKELAHCAIRILCPANSQSLFLGLRVALCFSPVVSSPGALDSE